MEHGWISNITLGHADLEIASYRWICRTTRAPVITSVPFPTPLGFSILTRWIATQRAHTCEIYCCGSGRLLSPSSLFLPRSPSQTGRRSIRTALAAPGGFRHPASARARSCERRRIFRSSYACAAPAFVCSADSLTARPNDIKNACYVFVTGCAIAALQSRHEPT